MSELPSREIETFLVLADELHFGRTADRMFISQGRVSQLISALERRIGAALVARTSRRVQLTDFGAEFLASLSPAYRALTEVLGEAQSRARDVPLPIRVGFQGAIYEAVARAISRFERQYPMTVVRIKELPLGDPFSDVLAGRVDAAVVLLPVEEPELKIGPIFSEESQMLALSVEHPLSNRRSVAAEQLAEFSLVPLTGPAPDYWLRVHSPRVTPSGVRIHSRGGASTLQEGLSQVASSHTGLILCAATAAHSQRADVRFVPLKGVPNSALGLVWRADRESTCIRQFADAIESAICD